MSFAPKPTHRVASAQERWAAALDMPFSFGRAFAENVDQGILDSFGLGTVIRDTMAPGNLGERIDNRTGYKPMFDPFGILDSGEKSLTEDEYKSSQYFRKTVPWSPGMTESRAAALAGFNDLRAARAHFSEKQPVAAFLGQFAGQMFDPINYVPVFGPAARTAAIARMGGLWGRVAVSSSEAAINTAAFGVLTSDVRRKLGDDVSFNVMAMEIGMSALIGGAFGAGIAFPAMRNERVRAREGARFEAAEQSWNRVRMRLNTVDNQARAAIPLNGAIHGLATRGEVDLNVNERAEIERAERMVAERTAGPRSLRAETATVVGNKPGEVAITPTGTRVAVRPEVVELETLVRASGDLQVRNRANAASAAQVEDIAINLDPARLMPNVAADLGAPIVGADNVIDSGNGRVMAIARAYEAYPERADAYRAALAEAGYAVEGMRQPVLVSRRLTELSPAARAQFNAEANSSGTARMSAVEIAMMDRAAMDDSVLGAFDDGPVTAAGNRAFVSRFLDRLPQNERGALIAEDGVSLNADGQRRIENALVAEAYGDEGVIRRFTVATDDNTRAVIGAMSDVAGRWAQMRRSMKNGEIGPEFDVTPELLVALRSIAKWRDQAAKEGRAVSTVIREGMGQLDLLSGAMPPEAQVFVRMFYRNDQFAQAVGRDTLAARLGKVIDSAYELGRPSLFGDALPVTKEEMLRNAADDQQADIFAADGAQPGTQGGSARGVGRASGADSGGNRQDAGEGIAAGAAPRSAIEADAGELLRLAEAGDIDGIKRSEALMRVTEEMRSRPTTDSVAGYGSQEWADGRRYATEDGEEIIGVEAAQDHLLTNARTLAAKELGIEPYAVAAERKAVIIIGPPAAGKSTIANQIALRLKAAIPDPDEAKRIMPEYGGGIGSNATHEESSFLTRYVMEELAEGGENMVIPKVGGSPKSIQRLAADLKEQGYTVDLALMDVEPIEAFRRMIGRYVRTGRLIPPDYFDEVASAPRRVYEEIKGEFDGYGKIESERGVPARLSESTLKTAGYATGDEIAGPSRGGDGGAPSRDGEGSTPEPTGRILDFTPPKPEPMPEGLSEAAARVGKGESLDDLAEQFGVDAKTGEFAELADIEQMREMGQLTEADEAELATADQDFQNATAWQETLKAAAICMV